ncbi:MAG: HD domain-containing protein [Candidatus Omnitrophica bacterium]|nr:HD domain-containing protein [Candidatus Omnitrophota bacterium]
MANLEKIEVFLRDFLISLQMAKLYGLGHKLFKESLEAPYNSLKAILSEQQDFTLGVIEGELAFEDQVIADATKLSLSPVSYLKEKKIEKVTFLRDIEKRELGVFMEFLGAPKLEIKKEVQDYLTLAGVRNIFVGKLKASSGPDPQAAKGIVSAYEHSFRKVSQSLTDILDNGMVDQVGLKLAMQSMMEGLLSQSPELLKVSTMRRYDLGTSVHLLNVAILSMYLASKAGFSKEDVMDLGTAALFHDIGKLYISRRIIRKTERLTDEEFDKIRSHALLGAELLLDYVDSLGILPVVVAFEHHLKYDLSGYPKIPNIKKPHIASLIVTICDVYDALFQKRSYKADYAPDMIYNIMIKEKGTSFEPELLEKFFQIMGVWPIGSLVYLSDGRAALVKEENEDAMLLPKVEVVFPLDKKETIDLKEKSSQLSIARYINPWKEGKEILDAAGIALAISTPPAHSAG